MNNAPKSQLWYLAGPMSGLPDYNFPAFNVATMRLRGLGYDILNPAETLGGDPTKPRDFYMRIDLNHVLKVDAVAVLPGWENSEGAKLEVAVAREIGIPVICAETLEPVETRVRLEAA